MSDGIKTQYRILAELKRTEEKIFRLKVELDRIPEELATLEKKISSQQGAYNTAKEKFDTQEKSLRKAEGDLKEKEDFLVKAEGRLNEVKTNQEYQAAQKENEMHKAEKALLEERTLTAMNSLEALRTVLATAEAEFKAQTSSLTEEKTKLQEEAKSLQKGYEELLEKRKGSVATLDVDTASLYGRVLTASRGVPIVKAENGMCQGCNMKVRPQLYNEILGHKAIHRCPSCGRILVVATESEDVPAEAAS